MMNEVNEAIRLSPLHSIILNQPDAALPIAQPTWHPATFSVNSGLNALVNGGVVLFSLLSRLWQGAIPNDISLFNDSLIQEVNAFEQKLLFHHAPSSDILIARFCICVALDEAIHYGPSDALTKRNSISLLNYFYNQQTNDDYFFEVMDELIKLPEKNKTLLIFMYFCLALGYEGKYRHLPDGKEHLIHLRHHLYTLTQHSTDSIKEISTPIPEVKNFSTNSIKYSYKSFILIILSFLSAYLFCWWGESLHTQILLSDAQQLVWPSSITMA